MTEHRSESADASAHVPLGASLHKALRRFLCDTLTRLGRIEPGDDAGTQTAIVQLHELLALLRDRLLDEGERRTPADPASPAGHRHFEAIGALEDETENLLAATAAVRRAALPRLYRALARLLADDFLHMHGQEAGQSDPPPSSDALPARMLGRAASPPRRQSVLYWLAVSVSASEWRGILRQLEAAWPADRYNEAMALIRATLDDAETARLRADLDAR